MVEKTKKTKNIKKKTVKKPIIQQPNSQILQKVQQVTDFKDKNNLPGILLGLVLIGIMILAAN